MKVLPTLRQIKYMTALADCRHFSKAAESCMVTQSTLSAGIQELEALLGVCLFERNKRSVIPTPAGFEAIRRGRELLRAAEELVDAVTAKEGMNGRLRLGVIPTIGPYLLPQALSLVREKFPRLSIYLHEDRTTRLLEKMEQGQLDLLILAFPCAATELSVEPLFDDAFVLVCLPDHPLARKKTINQKDLADAHLLLMEDGHCLRDHALSVCKRAAKNGDVQGTSLYTLVQMAAGGLGVTLLPTIAVQAGLLEGTQLVTRPLGGCEASRQIGMGWRKSSPQIQDFLHLASILRDVHNASLASEG